MRGAAAEPAISLSGFTKDYGGGRGVFDVSLDVARGEAMGFLGANGAGKTVTMRALMGFIRPDAGSVRIDGLDCFRDRARIQRVVGYLPGEVRCPQGMRGGEFLRFMAAMRGDAARGMRRMRDLAERFDLDLGQRIGRMSKGTKQKVALVCAFMDAPDVLLLDEPTSGFDPLMQERFVELLREERARGAAVLLSSHMFPEVERSCDRVALIGAGRLRRVVDAEGVRRMRRRAFLVTFASVGERGRYLAEARCGVPAGGGALAKTAGRARAEAPAAALPAGGAPALEVEAAPSVDAFLKELAGFRIADLEVRDQGLEGLFLRVCGEVPAEADGKGTR